MTPPPTIFINPYYIIFGIIITLMVIGIGIYVGLVRLVKTVRNRPKKVTHTYKLSPPGPPLENPIGVRYSDTIQLKEPTITPINEWDWL